MMQIAKINDIIVRKVYTVEIGKDEGHLTTEHVFFELRRRQVVPKFILVHLNAVHILSEQSDWESDEDIIDGGAHSNNQTIGSIRLFILN